MLFILKLYDWFKKLWRLINCIKKFHREARTWVFEDVFWIVWNCHFTSSGRDPSYELVISQVITGNLTNWRPESLRCFLTCLQNNRQIDWFILNHEFEFQSLLWTVQKPTSETARQASEYVGKEVGVDSLVVDLWIGVACGPSDL